jgi:HAD superfamily hydrolase (TIGR01549 family)
MKLDGIMFDLDGTLGETLPVCLAALGNTFKTFFGRDWSDEELLSYFGPTEEGVVKKLLPSKADECLKAYYSEYLRMHKLCTEPFPFIESVLCLLQEKNIKMAIVTAKGPETARISLEYLKLNKFFDPVVPGYEDANKKTLSIKKVLEKWDISPEKVAYVGDRPSDMTAAHETGLISLGAAWAETGKYHLLQKTRPYRIFKTAEDLNHWIRDEVENN